MAKAVGDELMTRYVVAFEVAGLLLTAALVGAIALAHREEDEPRRFVRRAIRPPRRRCEPAGSTERRAGLGTRVDVIFARRTRAARCLDRRLRRSPRTR